MRLYTVQHRPNGDIGDDPDVVLIKEGFCWPALFVPFLWLLYRGQLWGLLAYLGLTAGLSAVAYTVGLDEISLLLLSLVLSLLAAAQANDWRRWRLCAKGYELVTVVAAGNLRRAEEIFFHQRWQGPEAASKTIPTPLPTLLPTPLPASALTPFATPFDPV